MADFRKVSVLVALVLLMGMATTASAQATPPLTCTANAAVPPLLRAEGFTELTGDIVLDCTGGTPTLAGTAVPTVNFQLFYTAIVTSRTYSTSSPAPSEALLIIDEHSGAALRACTAQIGCGLLGTGAGGPDPYDGSATRPNVFQGSVSSNSVQFIGVPVDPPGTTAHRILRFTNVRVNANQLKGNTGIGGTPTQVNALVSASSSTALLINGATQVVGYVTTGLTFNVRKRTDSTSTPNTTTDISFAQCNSLSRTSSSGTNSFIAQFVEGFPTAFKMKQALLGGAPDNQNVPGTVYNTESGFYTVGGIAVATGNAAMPVNSGVADFATRLKLQIFNVPAGVNVFVGTRHLGNSTSTATALLMQGDTSTTLTAATNTDFNCDASELCNNGTSGKADGAQIPVNPDGSVTAVWEVTGSSTLQSESLNFAVWFSWTAGTNTPALGTATAFGGFAPTPKGINASATDAAKTSISLPIPRFVDADQSRAILNIYVCRTNLLFPFVTNQAGFDTGMAIANTSTDPFGTTAQTGSCTLYPYGANAPATSQTGNIASGAVWVGLTSISLPNFQGYIIAQCPFQFAHGFAFVSDFGARNLAMGYLALIIPDTGVGSRGVGSGESLSN